MAEDSAMREGSLPVSWGLRLVPSFKLACLFFHSLCYFLTLQDPLNLLCPSTLKFGVQEMEEARKAQKCNVLILATGSTMLASIVRIAWEREEARLRLVAPTERCFVAALIRFMRKGFGIYK